jgi:hypothetical protein
MGVMQLPQWLARFNRYFTNPLQRMWAGWAPTMGITDDGVAILLTYGPDRDWLKNIVSSNGGRMRRYGKTFAVTEPQVIPKAQAAKSVKGWMRPMFALLPFEQAVLLKRA